MKNLLIIAGVFVLLYIANQQRRAKTVIVNIPPAIAPKTKWTGEIPE
jgi:anti-anti-sigma regulatory factor